MIHSKSIQVLKTLSNEELKQFSDFLRSPFFNKNKNLIKLFDVLEKYHPVYDVENEKIFSKVYPGKEYNHDNVKKLMSELFLILEMFLSHLKLRKEKFTSDKYLLVEFRQRKLNELFLFKAKKVKEKMEIVNYYTCGFDDKFHLEDLIAEFYFLNNIECKVPLNTYIKRSEYSLCFFLENTLADIHDINVLKEVRNNRFKESIISETFIKSLDIKHFLKYLSENKIKSNLVNMFINLIMMLMCPENETYFERAKDYVLKVNFMQNNCKRSGDYFYPLIDHCRIMFHKGEKKYEIEQFELLKHIIKIELNNYNKIISVAYINIINVGLRLNEIKWVEEFMKNNTKYLEERDRENTYNFSKAFLEFTKQNYEECLTYTSKLSVRTSYYDKIDINILTLRCYFELSLYDSALSLIDSTKHYLSKESELDAAGKDYFDRYLSIICKLFKLKFVSHNYGKDELLNLRFEIINSKFPGGWFLQKVEEFEKSISGKSFHAKLNKKPQTKKLLKTG